MNIKSFLFWTGVVALGIIAAYVLIEWLKKPALALVQKSKREAGFHTIMTDREAAAAIV